MRKIIVSEFVTLGGVMESPEKWQFPYYSDDLAEGISAQILASDAMLLGRVTYEVFAAYWPSHTQAKAVAGDKNVGVMGANTAQQCIKAGLLDEIQIHLVPVLLGEGIRLFDHLGTQHIELESTRVIESPGATHLSFRVVKDGGNRP